MDYSVSPKICSLKYEGTQDDEEFLETGRFKRLFSDVRAIGKGGFGEVFIGKHRREEKLYAIKRIILPLDLNTKLEENKFF